jgi:hypothetical protein
MHLRRTAISSRFAVLAIAVIWVLTASCGARLPPHDTRAPAQLSSTPAGASSQPRPPAPPSASASTPSATATAAATRAATAGQRGPVLVYTARLTMAVFDVQPGQREAAAVARDLGGFMARQSNDAITIRVPAARFHDALARLEKLGDITARDIDAEDVTQEYLDLELRIRSARAVRDRLQQLLARATRVADSIAIERELERVVTELERLEGRLEYLRDRVQLATITITFAARSPELVAKDTFRLPFPWLDQLGLGRLLELHEER